MYGQSGLTHQGALVHRESISGLESQNALIHCGKLVCLRPGRSVMLGLWRCFVVGHLACYWETHETKVVIWISLSKAWKVSNGADGELI